MPRLDRNTLNIPPYIQITIHILCVIFYNANGQGLVQDEYTAKWITTIIGSAQSVLGIYGVFTTPPTSAKPSSPSGKR